MSLVTQNNKRIFGLDFVRATAIILVIFSHIYYLIGSTNPFLISVSGMFGYIGVELFFVLSGFLIGTLLLELYLSEEFSPSKILFFLKRRWFRTLPNYYLLLICNIIIALIIGYDLNGLWRYFLFIQNFNTYSISLFPESWSLSIEEWSYITAPVLLFLAHKIFNENKKMGFIVTILVLIIIVHFIRYFHFLNNKIVDMSVWNTQLKSIVLLRLDVIFYGFIIAWVHYFYKNYLKKLSVYLFIIAIHLFFLQFFVLNVLGVDIAANPLYFNVFYFTLTSISVMMFLPVFIFVNASKNILTSSVTLISKISYSMYLLHYSVISVLIKYVGSKFAIDSNVILIIFTYFISTFLISYFVYNYYEKPFMNLRDKF